MQGGLFRAVDHCFTVKASEDTGMDYCMTSRQLRHVVWIKTADWGRFSEERRRSTSVDEDGRDVEHSGESMGCWFSLAGSVRSSSGLIGDFFTVDESVLDPAAWDLEHPGELTRDFFTKQAGPFRGTG